jgi:hypothetical protein
MSEFIGYTPQWQGSGPSVTGRIGYPFEVDELGPLPCYSSPLQIARSRPAHSQTTRPKAIRMLRS